MKALSGTFKTGTLLATKTYVLTCTGSGGTASAKATVTYIDVDDDGD
jgi:hypothetical protein